MSLPLVQSPWLQVWECRTFWWFEQCGLGEDLPSLPPTPPYRAASFSPPWSSVACGLASSSPGSASQAFQLLEFFARISDRWSLTWRGSSSHGPATSSLSLQILSVFGGKGRCPGLQDRLLEHRAAPQVRGDPAECICQAWWFLKFLEMF